MNPINLTRELKSFSAANMYYSLASGFDCDASQRSIMRDTFERVCNYYNKTIEEVIKENRDALMVKIRYITAYILELDYGFDYKEVAIFLKKDKATIHHGLRTIKGYIEMNDQEYVVPINNLKRTA